MVGILVSFWKSLFSGAMLVSGSVTLGISPLDYDFCFTIHNDFWQKQHEQWSPPHLCIFQRKGFHCLDFVGWTLHREGAKSWWFLGCDDPMKRVELNAARNAKWEHMKTGQIFTNVIRSFECNNGPVYILQLPLQPMVYYLSSLGV